LRDVELFHDPQLDLREGPAESPNRLRNQQHQRKRYGPSFQLASHLATELTDLVDRVPEFPFRRQRSFVGNRALRSREHARP